MNPNSAKPAVPEDIAKPLPNAEEIAQRYHVCEGCDRLVTRCQCTGHCPVCGMYRFDGSIERVSEAALHWSMVQTARKAAPKNRALLMWEDFNRGGRRS